MGIMESAIDWAREHRESQLRELCELVAIPSISTDPERAAEMRRAAEWLLEWIRRERGNSELIETDGYPIVWGEFPATDPKAPSLLLYGHYDVQPADPLALWESDPFSPTVRGDRLYGRGASDMKAQILAGLFAVKALLEQGDLPVTVRVLFEGEEEIGSPSLAKALERHGDRFRADVCLNTDVGMLGPETPSIRYGLRGIACFELRLTGPTRDLHSGGFGGVVHNPAQALTEILAGMHDEGGRVTLPGFYDRVRRIDEDERARLSRVPFTDAVVKSLSGVPQLWGEREYSPAERIGARPTLEINGIESGYTGPGTKTVIPAVAMAKLSMRLVPDQRVEEVRGQLEAYLSTHAPPSVSWELTEFAGGGAFICDPRSPPHQAMSASLTEVWGIEPILSRSGGSVPVAADLQDILGIPSVLTGFALPDDRVHSPNESQHLPTWYRGVETIIRFIDRFSRVPV